METEKNTWSEFPNRGKTIVEQILASEERNKSKKAGLWVTVRDPSRKVNLMSKVICQKNYNRVHQVYQFHQDRLAIPYDGCYILQRQTH